MERVVVTGIGQVSALGEGIAPFSDGIFGARPGISKFSPAVPGLTDPIVAAIPAFAPKAEESGMPRVAQYALRAASEAVEGAGLARSERATAGVFVGTGFGAIVEIEETYRRCFESPGSRPRPSTIPTAMANAAAGLLSSHLGLKGPSLTFCVACSSASHAIGAACRELRHGALEVAIAGGTEAPLTSVVLAAWNVMRVLAPSGADPARACRPFAVDRSGLVLGEGAGFLVLETLAHAQRRGVRARAEILGYGANSDAGHVTHPDPAGVESCLKLALQDAGITPGEVGYVNAHGTGTVVNDRVEAGALSAVFGPGLLVSSTKAVHGHAMGASGALEAIATILTLESGRIPPTANLSDVDPDLPPLEYVRGAEASTDVRVGVSSSFAFGGSNAVLVFRRAD